MHLSKAIALACLMASGVLASGQIEAAERRATRIEAQDLASALERLAMERNIHVVYRSEMVGARKTGGVTGELTMEEALDGLLQGTGLTFRYLGDNSITIVPVEESTPSAAEASGRDLTGHGQVPQNVQATAMQAEASAETETDTRPRARSGNARVEEMDAVMVTGSRLSRTSVEGPVPVNIYSAEQIQRSGQTTVSGFLNTLAEVSVGTPEDGPVYAGQTSVRLRGLPLGSTLVLLNGRRLQNGGASAGYGSYFDLNNIPAAAIERIEVAPEGSSAIYGSDALAGVVNIILKKDFDGFQGNVRYGAASGIDEAAADVAWGMAGERGAWSVIASYFTRSSLHGTEREATTTIRERSVDYCNPGNVYSVDGSNLPGLGAPSAGIRAGAPAAPTLADFDPGRLNACSQTYDRGSIPPAQRASVFASGSYRVAPWVELFAELAYTHQEQSVDNGRRRLLRQRVPASNAYNPFGTDVLVSYRFDSPLAGIVYSNRTEFTRPLLGARGDFLDDWDWEFAVWDARDKSRIHQNAQLANSANLAAALASSDPATALNLFTDGTPASDAILASIYSVDRVRMSGRSQVANGFVRGPLFTLPSGPVNVVLGAEYVRSELTWASLDNPADIANFSHQRIAKSVFSEVRVPIVGARPGFEGTDVLAFSGAVRYDAYDDIGSHVTPQYALEWRPLRTLLVRGAYAQSFKAPGLVYLHYPLSAFPDCCTILDPRNGGAATTYTFMRQGDPNLKPETGESRSVGLVWSPEALRGLEASLTWWKIEQTDRVAELPPQTVVDNEDLFPGRVVRNPVTGAIVSITSGFLNFGEMQVSGFDLGLSYRLETAAGAFSPRLSVSRVARYDAGVTPGAPLTDRVSNANSDAWAPEWKSVASLGWDRGPYSVNMIGRYISQYTDYQDLGPTSRQLGDFWLFDLSAQYEFGRVFAANNRYLRDAFFQLSVVNLFNSLPDVYSSFNGGSKSYDPMQYDIRGRFISATVGIRF